MNDAHSSSIRAAGRPVHRISRGLTALSSAAVLTVYTAGYVRTRAASERIASGAAGRRRAAPITIETSAPAAPARPEELTLPTRPAAGSPAIVAEGSEPATVRPATEQPQRRTRTASQGSAPVVHSTRIAPTNASSALGASTMTAATAVRAPLSSEPSSAVPLTSGSQPASASALSAGPVSAASVSPSAAPTPVSSAPITPLSAAAALNAAASPARSGLKDGTYTGWGSCRHGDIQAAVVIANGRIASAQIAQCLTRYSCSWIEALPPQVVRRQSPEVDYVSGATQSTDAFYGAIVDALSKAK